MVRTALRQNSSTKCVEQLGSPGADLAKTDNTDRFALDLPADKTGLVLSFTAAVFHTAEIPGKRKRRADDQLGNCLVGVTGSIADGDILLLGSIQTNMIHTGKSNINKLELVTLAQDIGRHRHIGKDHSVCILGFFDQFGGIGGFGIIHKHMALCFKRCFAGGKLFGGDAKGFHDYDFAHNKNLLSMQLNDDGFVWGKSCKMSIAEKERNVISRICFLIHGFVLICKNDE